MIPPSIGPVWNALFSGKLFAMLVVYSDETGTGGIPKTGEEPAPGVYGWLATPEMWEDFRDKWKAGLALFDVPYFHFSELNPNVRQTKGHPYSRLDRNRVDDFIYEMAVISSSGPIPFGGNVSQRLTIGPSPDSFQTAAMYREMFYDFFADYKDVMDVYFPKETGKTSFFFSDIDNDVWIRILNQVMKDVRQNNPSIAGEYTPIDPYSERGMPCQAADLFAYVNRQNSANIYKSGRVLRPRLLDLIIARQLYRVHPVLCILPQMPESEWRALVTDMRKQKREFEEKHIEIAGKKPIYYPTLEHPFFKQLRHASRHPASKLFYPYLI